jgi:hypothetical protein
VDTITANCGKEAEAYFVNPKPPYTREDALKLARRGPEEQREILAGCWQGVFAKPWREETEGETIRVPVDTDRLIAALVRQLGPKRMQEVYSQMGKALFGEPPRLGAG